MQRRLAVIAMSTLIFSACVTNARADEPAVLINTNADGHAELQQVVSNALDSAPVTLADDALAHDSTLFIERTPRRDASGQLLNGRVLEKPERFTLVLRDTRCVLLQDSTHREWVLRHAQCVAK